MGESMGIMVFDFGFDFFKKIFQKRARKRGKKNISITHHHSPSTNNH
jgi:hypothetical protein